MKLVEILKPIPSNIDESKFRASYVKEFSDSVCWPWIEKLNEDGYGIFYISNYGLFLAPRVAYYLAYNKDPGKNLVLHAVGCIRSCVNPSHLRLGDQSENMYQMHEEGNHIKLGLFSDSEIKDIFNRAICGETETSIAKIYNVHHCTIGRILRGERYSHLKPKDYIHNSNLTGGYGGKRLFDKEQILDIFNRASKGETHTNQ